MNIDSSITLTDKSIIVEKPLSKEDMMDFLNSMYNKYNNPEFVLRDPISIPHSFDRKQDIEISGFFAAIFAWGNRKIIINKSRLLMDMMDNAPYDFISNYEAKDLNKIKNFKHRTFNYEDLEYCIEFLKFHYSYNDSLESAFTIGLGVNDRNIENSLINFQQYFFCMRNLNDFKKGIIEGGSSHPDSVYKNGYSSEKKFISSGMSIDTSNIVCPMRTRRHISSPHKNSACKRINMLLRWMVRKDENGVDLGIWNNISPSQLIIPCDVHVLRVARSLGLLVRTQDDWKAALELTDNLKSFCPQDPVKYDFALFGVGESHIL